GGRHGWRVTSIGAAHGRGCSVCRPSRPSASWSANCGDPRAGGAPPMTALRLLHVGLVRDHTVILDDVTWAVEPGERWIVLGANGSGKTTLVRISSLYLHPSTGDVEVLGQRLGRVDV